MNSKMIIMAVVAVVVLGGIGFVVMQNQATTSTQPVNTSSINDTEEVVASSAPMPVPGEENTTELADTQVVQEITVESNGLNFTPKEIRVKKGDIVKLTYKNNKGKHDWKLDEFNAATKLLNQGEQETIEFSADKTGEFEFYCSVPGHKQAGMKGMLIVE